jgi:hypothetical protein
LSDHPVLFNSAGRYLPWRFCLWLPFACTGGSVQGAPKKQNNQPWIWQKSVLTLSYSDFINWRFTASAFI